MVGWVGPVVRAAIFGGRSPMPRRTLSSGSRRSEAPDRRSPATPVYLVKPLNHQLTLIASLVLGKHSLIRQIFFLFFINRPAREVVTILG